jgi:hypothetical protein
MSPSNPAKSALLFFCRTGADSRPRILLPKISEDVFPSTRRNLFRIGPTCHTPYQILVLTTSNCCAPARHGSGREGAEEATQDPAVGRGGRGSRAASGESGAGAGTVGEGEGMAAHVLAHGPAPPAMPASLLARSGASCSRSLRRIEASSRSLPRIKPPPAATRSGGRCLRAPRRSRCTRAASSSLGPASLRASPPPPQGHREKGDSRGAEVGGGQKEGGRRRG